MYCERDLDSVIMSYVSVYPPPPTTIPHFDQFFISMVTVVIAILNCLYLMFHLSFSINVCTENVQKFSPWARPIQSFIVLPQLILHWIFGEAETKLPDEWWNSHTSKIAIWWIIVLSFIGNVWKKYTLWFSDQNNMYIDRSSHVCQEVWLPLIYDTYIYWNKLVNNISMEYRCEEHFLISQTSSLSD